MICRLLLRNWHFIIAIGVATACSSIIPSFTRAVELAQKNQSAYTLVPPMPPMFLVYEDLNKTKNTRQAQANRQYIERSINNNENWVSFINVEAPINSDEIAKVFNFRKNQSLIREETCGYLQKLMQTQPNIYKEDVKKNNPLLIPRQVLKTIANDFSTIPLIALYTITFLLKIYYLETAGDQKILDDLLDGCNLSSIKNLLSINALQKNVEENCTVNSFKNRVFTLTTEDLREKNKILTTLIAKRSLYAQLQLINQAIGAVNCIDFLIRKGGVPFLTRTEKKVFLISQNNTLLETALQGLLKYKITKETGKLSDNENDSDSIINSMENKSSKKDAPSQVEDNNTKKTARKKLLALPPPKRACLPALTYYPTPKEAAASVNNQNEPTVIEQSDDTVVILDTNNNVTVIQRKLEQDTNKNNNVTEEKYPAPLPVVKNNSVNSENSRDEQAHDVQQKTDTSASVETKTENISENQSPSTVDSEVPEVNTKPTSTKHSSWFKIGFWGMVSIVKKTFSFFSSLLYLF